MSKHANLCVRVRSSWSRRFFCATYPIWKCLHSVDAEHYPAVVVAFSCKFFSIALPAGVLPPALPGQTGKQRIAGPWTLLLAKMRLHRPAKYKSTKVQKFQIQRYKNMTNTKLQNSINSNRSAKPTCKNEIAQARVFLVGRPRLEWSLLVWQHGRSGREKAKKEEKLLLSASCVEASGFEAFGKCKVVKLFTVE